MNDVISADEAREMGSRHMWPFDITITHWMIRIRFAIFFNLHEVIIGYSPNRTRINEAIEYMRELGYEVRIDRGFLRFREPVVIIGWKEKT